MCAKFMIDDINQTGCLLQALETFFHFFHVFFLFLKLYY